ncbi:MAG: hypothetical protein ABJ013_05545 [Halioglobus sp.]
MKKPVSKEDIRKAMTQEVEQFLRDGGEVNAIPTGLSGHDAMTSSPFTSKRLFLEPSGTRTLVPEVVASIEARRKDMLKRTPARKRTRLPTPRKKVIYDDFGEPVRKIWVEE